MTRLPRLLSAFLAAGAILAGASTAQAAVTAQATAPSGNDIQVRVSGNGQNLPASCGPSTCGGYVEVTFPDNIVLMPGSVRDPDGTSRDCDGPAGQSGFCCYTEEARSSNPSQHRFQCSVSPPREVLEVKVGTSPTWCGSQGNASVEAGPFFGNSPPVETTPMTPPACGSPGGPPPPGGGGPTNFDGVATASRLRASLAQNTQGSFLICSTDERKKELQRAWEDAKFWSGALCGTALVAEIVSGAAIVRGGFMSKGGIAGIAGGTTAAAICLGALEREQQAATDLNNDPPDALFKQVGLPPAAVTLVAVSKACSELASKHRSSCRKTFGAFMRERARVNSLLRGIYTTQNRFSSARTAGDHASVALQNAVLRTYSGEMVAAFAAEERFGKSLSALLRRAGVRFVLPAANVQAAFDSLRSLTTLPAPFSSGLQRVGIDPATFPSVIAQALSGVTARRVDLVALFGRHVSMSAARADHRRMTVTELGAILNALKAQGALKGKTASKLTADYAGVTKAKGAKKRRAAIRKLIAHAKAKHTKAGDFLATAAAGVK